MAHPIYKTKENKRVPSVTTVLKFLQPVETLMKWAVEEVRAGRDPFERRDTAADTGTIVHTRIENWTWGQYQDMGIGDAVSRIPQAQRSIALQEADQAYANFHTWMSSRDFAILATEVSMVWDGATEESNSSILPFGGSFDAVGIADGTLTVVDWKSSKRIYSSHLAQVAAYAWLVEHGRLLDQSAETPYWVGQPVQRAVVLQLSKTGPEHDCLELGPEELAVGFGVFQECRALYQHSADLEKVLREHKKKERGA